MKKIIIASDHGAVILKDSIISFLKTRGCEIKDMGINSDESVDYPDIAVEACREFNHGGYDFGVLLCGTGIGMSMTCLLRKWPKPIIMPIFLPSVAG